MRVLSVKRVDGRDIPLPPVPLEFDSLSALVDYFKVYPVDYEEEFIYVDVMVNKLNALFIFYEKHYSVVVKSKFDNDVFENLITNLIY